MPPELPFYENLFAAFAFVLGAVVGSFLNVCIYRIPRELSVGEPRRSFCPACRRQIPWFRNIPLLSWILLRGKCADCDAPIAFRYFVVELATALLFLGVWRMAPGLEAAPYWLFVSGLVAATFIDLEHLIIPDRFSLGGVVAGLVCSALFPSMMDVSSRMESVLWSLAGAAAGYATLWIVVEAGKKVFGKKRVEISGPASLRRDGDDYVLAVGDESVRWSELFYRETDRLIAHGAGFRANGRALPIATVEFAHDRLVAGEEVYLLAELREFGGELTALVVPREAMGLGDVKFIAAIGAFLGWKAVFFSIFAASVLGAAVGLTAIALRKQEWSAQIPFGPYLAAGALLWLLAGHSILAWYMRALILP